MPVNVSRKLIQKNDQCKTFDWVPYPMVVFPFECIANVFSECVSNVIIRFGRLSEPKIHRFNHRMWEHEFQNLLCFGVYICLHLLVERVIFVKIVFQPHQIPYENMLMRESQKCKITAILMRNVMIFEQKSVPC